MPNPEETKILIIDDDTTMLDSCCQVFAKEGYDTLTAENGDEGLGKVRQEKPDLVLVDLKMPGKSGIDVLTELKKMDPNCVAIVITGYGTIESAVEAMKVGAYDFLPKPFTPDELRFMVRRGLERRHFIIQNESLMHEKEMMRNNFISMVSHELRSPLAAVQQNLMVITGGIVGEIPDKAQDMLERMQVRIKGLIGLISDWLDLSRIESGEMVSRMEPVSLKDVLSEVIDMLKPLTEEKNIRLNLDIPDDYPTILANQETLHMLFTNLIHNAIKYNKEGGRVTVSVEEEDQRTKIAVSDTGVGIPKENLPLIFEQFYRVKNGKHIVGSGLGLSIALKIIEAHHGTISVTSKLDKGTTFTIQLP